jgi:hypothetical protein
MATTAIGNDATDLNAIMQSAMAGSYVAQSSTERTFTVSKTIVITVNSTTQGPLGLDLGGGTIVSNITDGSPVIKIVVGPNVDLRYLTLANFTIQGNGREGSGIQIVAGANDRWVYNFTVDNVTVNHVGGYGLDVQGSVFEGIISDSWMTSNGKGGAYFSHLADGQASALRWVGGGFENNSGAGMMLDNGVRDMSVDGATFSGNTGGGISAGSGITAVSHSDFIDNKGQGVWFQNYGNFDNNSFTTSGTQGVGVTGWLNGNATVVNSTSTWTGTGADPTTLANLQGYGGVFTSGDVGKIVTGSQLSVSGPGGGSLAQVSVGNQGVALPTLAPVTAATAAPIATTNGTGAVETALKAAVATGNAHLTESSYTVSAPIVINLTSASQGPIDIDFGGAKIQSAIGGGGPVIQFIVGAGVNVSQLTLSNLLINGNGSEGAGIKIVADGADRSIRNLGINGVHIEHVGGIGLDVIGNVHGTVFDSWMNGNHGGGARFANSTNGGVADGLFWIGGGFRKNDVAGLILDNGTKDMTVKHAYFVENVGVGILATSGIALIKSSGFENNGGIGAVIKGTSTFIDDTFSTWGAQKVGIGGYLSDGQLNMMGVSGEYYGAGGDPTAVANLQGTGTLAIAGSGKVVVGSGITVTGGMASVPVGDPTSKPITGTVSQPVVPVVTEKLVSDTGNSASDGITSSAALSGTADPGATIKFTVDGTPIAAAATADATGKWSFTPTGLSDGQHTIVASQTNAAGQTGTATLTFTLDTKAPVVTGMLVGGGSTTTTGALTGTADPNATLRITVDGAAVATTITADATGKWTYTPTGLATGAHTVVATSRDTAGNTASAALSFTVSAPVTAPTVTQKLSNDTGSSASDRITSNATISGTADPNAVVRFTIDGVATGQTVTANASGAWSFTPTGLADGQHTIVASQSNAAGATGSASLTFSLDTKGNAPVFTGATWANGQATVTGSTGAAGDVVSIYDGNSWAGFATTDANGKFSFTGAAAAGSTHSYGAIVTDLAGNEAKTTAPFVYTAGTAAPPAPVLPTVTSKLATDTGSSATDKITSNATTSGTAEPNAVIRFTIDGVSVSQTVTANAGGTWSFTPTGLANGSHTIVASQTNAAGTGSSALTFTLDTVAPGMTSKLAYDTGSSATDRVTSNAALSGTSDPGAVIKLMIDGTPIAATVTADTTGKWSYTPTGLTDGAHTVVASSTDAAGNTGSASLAFTLDTKGNVPVFTGATWANGQATVTGSTGAAGDVLSIYDGSSWAGFVTTDANGKFSFTTAAAAGSAHSFGAIVTDLAGNEGKTTSPFVYTAGQTAPAPVLADLPVVTQKLLSDTGASGTDGITANAALTGTADPNAVVHFAIDGTPIVATATASASGVWNFTPTGLSEGFHTVEASVTNAAGATGTSTIGFAYNASAPLPIFTDESYSNGQVTLTGAARDASTIVMIYDGSTLLGATITGVDGKFSFTTAASPGVHAYGADTFGTFGQVHGPNKAILGTTDLDALVGTAGNDMIVGNGGNDTITGGLGADRLTGGADNVTFAYTSAAESTSAAADIVTDFQHGADKIDFTAIAGVNASGGVPAFQGYLTGTGSLTLNAHSVAVLEAGGSTHVLVNTSNVADTVTATDMHAADMKIILLGVNLGLTSSDFHHA